MERPSPQRTPLQDTVQESSSDFSLGFVLQAELNATHE
jgi:hypothetical protein